METKPLYNETELLIRIAEGESYAFKLIFNKFHGSVYTFALWYLKSEVEAEEVVQEIFLKLWQQGKDISKINNLESYLKTLTRNRSLDILRHRARVAKANYANTSGWQESHNETEQQILLNDTTKVLNEAVNRLPNQQKLVYQLCVQQGFKNNEVAERLKLSPLTVRTHMKHALKFLRIYVSKRTDLVVIFLVSGLF